MKKIIIFTLFTIFLLQKPVPVSAFDATASAVPAATGSAQIEQTATPTTTQTPTPAQRQLSETPTPTKLPPAIPPLDQTSLQSASLRQPIFLKPLAKNDYLADESISAQVVVSPGDSFTAELFNSQGEKQSIEIQTIPNADFILLHIDPSLEIRPGKYKLKVTDSSGSESFREFNWANLALNFDQSVYQPGQNAGIALSLADEKGKFVCDADISFVITGSGSETIYSGADGSVVKSEECPNHTEDTSSDYQTTFPVPPTTGTYSLDLTAKLKNEIFQYRFNFAVKDTVPLLVKRQSATRANSQKWQTNILTVSANRDFTGEIRELLPENFDVSPSLETGQLSYDKLDISQSPFIKSSGLGVFIPPLTVPFKGVQTSTLGFGENIKDPLLIRIYSQFGLAGHDGIDFDLPQGTPVVAADNGMVVLSGEGDYGTTIVIQHDWGKSYYGHLSKIDVTFGQRVEKGQEIGLSGNTGLSTGAHLHFGIKPNKNDVQNGYYGKINPLPYLAQNPGQVEGYSPDTNYPVKLLGWNLSLKKGDSVNLAYRTKLPQGSVSSYLLGPVSVLEQGSLSPEFIEDRFFQIFSDPPPALPGANFEPQTQVSFPMEKIDPQLFKVPADFTFVKSELDKEIKNKLTNQLFESAAPSFQMAVASPSGQINGIRFGFDTSSQSASLTSVASNRIQWGEILPSVDFSYDTYDGYIDQKILVKNDSAQKDFQFNAELSDNLIAEDYFGYVIIKDKNSEEEFFLLRFPQGVDASNQRIDYKYKIDGNKLILYPNRSWQLAKAVYPITIYAPVNVIAWNETNVQVGENCPDPACGKDGDILEIHPAGWWWGTEEQRIQLQIKVPKINEMSRREFESVSEKPPDNDIDLQTRKLNKEYHERVFNIGGLHRYGIDYSQFASPQTLNQVRDLGKSQKNPRLDSRNETNISNIFKKKTNLQASVIPDNKRFAWKPPQKLGLFRQLINRLIPVAYAQTTCVYSIGSAAGRNYTTVALWEADRQGTLGDAGSGDCTSAEASRPPRIEEGDLYKDSDFSITVKQNIDGSTTTDSTHYMYLTARPSERHNGTAGTGVVFVCGDCASSAQDFLGLSDDYTRVEWFEVKSFKNGGRTALDAAVATNVLIQNIIIHDFSHATGLDMGIKQSSSAGGDDSMTVRNTIIYDGGNFGIRGGNDADIINVDNLTVYGMVDTDNSTSDGKGLGVLTAGSDIVWTIRNTISMNNNRDDFYITAASGSTCSYSLCEDDDASTNDCALTDASVDCTNSLKGKSPSNQFVSTTAGSEDFHLKSGADAIDNGTNLSATFNNDIDNTSRTYGNWDIGADEFPYRLNDAFMRHGKYYNGMSEEPFRF